MTTQVAVGNAAVDSTKGTIYQLYLAVLKCYELTKGQSVFVERYGDVTVTGAEQIEVKHYDDALTDSHLNFWRTVGNWLRPEFDESKYASLILFTTQMIGKDSRFEEWNNADVPRRLAIMQEILAEGEARYAARAKDCGINQPILQVPESLRIQRQVLHLSNAAKLKEVLARMSIVARAPGMEELLNQVKQRFCKGVLEGKKDDMCASLLGFVISPQVVNQQGWEITYDQFEAKCGALLSQYCKETRIFPTKYRRSTDSPAPAVPATRFVQNILDIDYAEVITRAVKDYLYASDTVMKDFAAYERPTENYQIFSEAVLNQFGPHQAIARRKRATEVDGEKSFYDETQILPVPGFPGFETPDASFRNGVLHMHQDDAARNLNWKLK